jgi:hypothetical protein
MAEVVGVFSVIISVVGLLYAKKKSADQATKNAIDKLARARRRRSAGCVFSIHSNQFHTLSGAFWNRALYSKTRRFGQALA